MSQSLNFKKVDGAPSEGEPAAEPPEEVVVVARPQPPPPGADDVNGLVRNHWFNGKLLTGKALSREQRYNDLRDRLLAQIHGEGIAWGLGLELPPQRPPLPSPRDPYEDGEDHGRKEEHRKKSKASEHADHAEQFGKQDGSICPDETLVLQEGLAFDDTGAPIFVGRRYPFTLDALIDDHQKRPAVVTRATGRFSPCLCLHETSYPPGYQGFQPGVYVLVIQPGECPTGPAKVHHTLCKDASDPCVPDGIREGFHLRLVYLPVPWESFHESESAWAQRSSVAHWFHEVFEHPLHERWTTPPLRGACEAAAQRTPSPRPIALAAVFLRQDRTASWIDPWIPRRHITDTRSASALHHALGAPTSSASQARIRQFQCQLDEVRRLDGARGRNLYDLGFRAIPPAGFLPLDLPPVDKATPLITYLQLTQARKAARRWFEGTNLIPIVLAAPMDDDVLLELQRAVDQDMVPVRPTPKRLRIDLGRLFEREDEEGRPTVSLKVPFAAGLAVVGALFRSFAGVTMEQLVNREIAFVRVIVPMEGMRRDYPGIGRVKGPRTAGEAALLRAAMGFAQTGDGGHDEPLLGDFFGLSANPYPWVVYHRQRVVLLEAIYMLLDLLGDFLVLLASTQTEMFAKTVEGGQTRSIRSVLLQEQGGGELMLGATALTEAPEVRELLAVGTRDYAPDAGSAGLWARYRSVEKAALGSGADPVEAADRATDAVMEVSPAGNVLRVFGVIAPATRDALVSDLERRAAVEGGVRERDTLAMRAYHPDDRVSHFESAEERRVFDAVDAVLRETPITELDGLAGRSGTAGDLLDRTESAIREDQPEGTTYVSNTLVGHARKLRAASVDLAKAGWARDEELRAAVEAALAESETVAGAAEKVASDHPKAAKALEVVGETLGVEATKRFVTKRW